MESSDLRITPSLAIPLSELDFRTSRSGGPGGQHVNTADTKVELLFDVLNSPTLSDTQKKRIQAGLTTRIDSEGVLHVVAQSHRSQLRNREEAVERFVKLLQAALKPKKKRRPTKPSKAARERRLQIKRERAEKKERRKRVDLD